MITPRLIIVNAITQPSVGSGLQVSYDGINKAFINLQQFADVLDPAQILPICFPMIGAGRGGGDWQTIAHMIVHHAWGNRVLNLYVVDVEPSSCQ
jgi:hypothetical protein